MPDSPARPVRFEDRVAWFQEARVGLFMHWGLYALPAKHEWIRSTERIPDDVYHRYAERFDPDKFDPRAWARLAREAGMRYFVVTTKHHDGFCLWDTRQTKWSAPHSAARRDLLRPILDAFRAEGLRVGLYYSLQDWDHPQYPIDVHHPLRDREDAAELNKRRDVRKYAAFMRRQVTELLTQYGKIDILWFDFSYPKATYRGFPGKGRDAWESRRLLDLVHELSPDTLVNDRLDLPGEGDFMTVEQKQLDEPPHGGPQAVSGSCLARCWENCHTFSGAWSYSRDESSWKSPKLCLQLLVQAVARGGNYILNVGPTARGEFDPRATDRLRVYADWMKYNARSIYGCGAAPEAFPEPHKCLYTYNAKTNRLYLHVLDWPYVTLRCPALGRHVAYAQFLHDGSEVRFSENGPGEQTDPTSPPGGLTFYLPDVQPGGVLLPTIEIFLK